MKITITIEVENEEADPLTTDQVADQLGMTTRALQSFLYRNPDLRPVGSHWTTEEIEAVRQKREEFARK